MGDVPPPDWQHSISLNIEMWSIYIFNWLIGDVPPTV